MAHSTGLKWSEIVIRRHDMLGDMAKMMKEAKNMQSKMKKAQKELAGLTVEGLSKDGKVSCTMDGQMALKKITIDPSMAGDIGAIEKAVNEAVKKAMDEANGEAQKLMSGVTGGMKIPGLF